MWPLALMVGGGVLSGIGQMQNNAAMKKQQRADVAAEAQRMQQDVAEAQLRTAIANEYAQRQRGYANQNFAALNDTIGATGAAGTQAAYDAGVAQRVGDANAAIGEAGPTTGLMASASPAVAGEFAKVIGKAYDDAKGAAARSAAVAGYGDASGTVDRRIGSGARSIDLTNNFARGDMSLLGADQDLQAFQIRKPIFRPQYNTNKGDLLKGIGSFMGTLAGSGKAPMLAQQFMNYLPK